jgi:hypothetical protein
MNNKRKLQFSFRSGIIHPSNRTLWEWPDLSCHSLVGSFKIEFFFFFESYTMIMQHYFSVQDKSTTEHHPGIPIFHVSPLRLILNEVLSFSCSRTLEKHTETITIISKCLNYSTKFTTTSKHSNLSPCATLPIRTIATRTATKPPSKITSLP